MVPIQSKNSLLFSSLNKCFSINIFQNPLYFLLKTISFTHYVVTYSIKITSSSSIYSSIKRISIFSLMLMQHYSPVWLKTNHNYKKYNYNQTLVINSMFNDVLTLISENNIGMYLVGCDAFYNSREFAISTRP